MDIEELCAATNRALEDEGIVVTDGRTAARVTPRNIRYYRTIGLIDPPRRDSGRAVYDSSHLEAVVAIKRSQSFGASLDELIEARRHARRPKEPDSRTALRASSSSGLHTTEETSRWSAQHALASVDTLHDWSRSIGLLSWAERADQGWAFRIGASTLSGFGPPPTTDQLDRVRSILTDEGNTT